MSKFIRAFFLSVTIVAIMLFSAVGTTIVYADDATPPPTPEAGTTPPPEESGTDDGSTTDAGTGTEEVAPVVEVVPPVEEVVTEVTAEPILEQVPDNVTVTVLNAEGEAQPLASQESADAIASTTDPIWCPATQATPTPGANGCTESFTSFDDLLSFLLANEGDDAYQQSGTIYIEQGAYGGGESSIDFNNYEFTNFNTHDLTLQGGWDPADNSVDSTSQFTAPIIIGSSTNPWAGSLTLNNLSISDVTGQSGLTLFTQGDIALSNVEVTNSQTGAELTADGDVTIDDSDFNNNNNAGATINAGGKVAINNTQFNNNGSGQVDDPTGYGVNIESGGAVSLASVSANNNQLFGANVQAVGNVVVTNGFFNGNQGYAYIDGWQYYGYGIQVVSTGNIALDGVAANDNYLFGAHLEGVNVEVANSSFNENDSDWHEHSIGYGLEVISTGDVTLSNVTANNNQRFGANIEATGEVEVLDSFFNGNKSYTYSCDGEKLYHGYGIRIVTTDDVSMQNVEAMGNHLFGAHINANDVAIDTANFSNNGSGSGLDLTGRGLEIISLNDVALIGVTANNNQLFGADIVAGDLVAIAQSYFNGHITYVYDYFTHEIASRGGGYGLRVVTGGNIALEDVTANNNYLYGAYLEGDDTAVEDSFFTANGSGVITEPTGYGLKIVSTGSVSLYNINAADSVGNQLFGADITAVQDVTIVNAFFSGHQSVTFTPCLGLTFYGYGLNVVTQGDISLDLVTANYNNLWGASLTGNNVWVSRSHFNNNVSDSNIFIDDTGLLVNASGFVDLYQVEAIENRLIGATITAGGDVFVAESNFSDNRGYTCSLDWCPEGSITYHGYGLQVTTPGLIQVTGTNASNNNLFGAQLNGGLVTVSNSTFNNNGMGNGLTINATDNVTLTNVTAVNNGGNGVDVTGVCAKLVQANGGTFTDNDSYGISVTDATLALDGNQVFANNSAGNIFTNTSACPLVLITLSNNSDTTNTNTDTGTDTSTTTTLDTTKNSDEAKIKKSNNTSKFKKNDIKIKKNDDNTKIKKNDGMGIKKHRIVKRLHVR